MLAKYHGRTLHDVKHNICKVNAKTFGCPMQKGIVLYVLYSYPIDLFFYVKYLNVRELVNSWQEY